LFFSAYHTFKILLFNYGFISFISVPLYIYQKVSFNLSMSRQEKFKILIASLNVCASSPFQTEWIKH